MGNANCFAALGLLLASCAVPAAPRLPPDAGDVILSAAATARAAPAPPATAPVAALIQPAAGAAPVLDAADLPATRSILPVPRQADGEEVKVHVGIGASSSPTTLLLGGSADFPLDEYLTFGPALQIGRDDNTSFFAPFGQIRYWFGKAADEKFLLPYAQAGVGFVYMDRAGRSGDTAFLLNLGGGVRLLTGEDYRIGSNVLFHFVPGDVGGEDTFLTWEIVQVSFDV